MSGVIWKLPFPSSGTSGARFREIAGGHCAIIFPGRYNNEDDPDVFKLIFTGVQAFKCTYFHACIPHEMNAYDRLVDLGDTEWLLSIKKQLAKHSDKTDDLRHLRIDFDDGPNYEFICRSFSVEPGVNY